MTKTVLITGSSSGIGKAAAIYFAQKGWQVAATMRSPEKEQVLTAYPNIRLYRLDVMNIDSIQAALKEIHQHQGKVDVLVNNAGYALVGPFEDIRPEQIQQQFETNVFGLMNMTRMLLPHFREQKSGTIINIASIGGRMAFPFWSLYHSTKWAVEGFSDSLQYELEAYHIRVKIIEPGPIKTDFYSRSMDKQSLNPASPYYALASRVLPRMDAYGEKGASPDRVAETIFLAATDHSNRLRYSPDFQGGLFLKLRRCLPDRLFSYFLRKGMLK